MNVCRVISRCSGLAKQSTIVARNLSRPNTTNVIQRRLLMTSLETGGVVPAKPYRRIGLNLKVPAFGLFCLTSIATAKVFQYDEEIAKALGVDWNMSLIALAGQMVLGYGLLMVTFCATLPL
uniref:Uncharacterized protein n=1 Tax=Ciona savignyi TaxID=51511 RepID=H2YTN1_CIOSA